MTEEEHKIYIDEMKKAIEETIRIVVNGKIDGMRKELAEYIERDEEWKVVAEPVIKAGNSLYSVGRLAVYFFGGLATIAGGVAVIKVALINIFK